MIAPLYQALRSARRAVRVLPSGRRAASGSSPPSHRRDHHGPTGPARRRRRRLRTADHGRGPAGLPRCSIGRPDRRATGIEASNRISPSGTMSRPVLRRGVDFDHVVLAASLGMVELVAAELIADRPEWLDMTAVCARSPHRRSNCGCAPRSPQLGWHQPGVTTSGYVAPFDTWASMPQTLWTEEWPGRRPSRTPSPISAARSMPHGRPDGDPAEYVARRRQRVLANA